MIKFKNIRQLFTLFSISVFLFCIVAGKTNAAELKLSSSIHEFGAGQQFKVDLVLDTENEIVNAIEGKVTFPEDLLELKEIRDGNSAINFWIEQPKLEQAGTIGFSGIIPGGFRETKGFLFSAIFQSKSNGNGVIKISDDKVLLNDGEGTEANVKISPFQFSISEKNQAVQPIIQPVEDTDPPEDFNPEIAQSQNMFGGQWFLVFSTQDKGSGIDHYRVCEGSKTKCVIAESPYVLKDQKLRSYIYIKAIDRAGNERVATVKPRYALPWYENYLIWLIIMVIALIIAFAVKKLWRKKHI